MSGRREMIRYTEFQSEGWQIGSGSPWATCETLRARAEGSSMRRDGGDTEAIMALEV